MRAIMYIYIHIYIYMYIYVNKLVHAIMYMCVFKKLMRAIMYMYKLVYAIM
jgi:hypothetical protein